MKQAGKIYTQISLPIEVKVSLADCVAVPMCTLTPKQLEKHEYVLSTMATISNRSADKLLIVFDQFHTKMVHWNWNEHHKKELHIKKKVKSNCLRVHPIMKSM